MNYIVSFDFVILNFKKIIFDETQKDKVIQPRKTTVEYELNRKTPIAQQVVLTLEEEATELNNNVTCTSSNASSSNNSIISSNIQFQQMNNLMNNSPSFANLLGNNGQLSTENVWKKRNLENAVNIPQETQTKSIVFQKTQVPRYLISSVEKVFF